MVWGSPDSYFALLLVPDTEDASMVFDQSYAVDGHLVHGVHYLAGVGLGSGDSLTRSFTLYAGPKDVDALAAVDASLTESVDLGFLAAIAWPLLWFMKRIYGVVGNWGIAIIVLTLLVKGAFFRMTQKAFTSGQQMQALAPKMQEIREKFGEDPERMNREIMALYKDSGVNPFGGCLPMLVQMPVWFALYTVLLHAVELYHVPFLYLKDLTEVDPYMVIPSATMVVMLIQQRLTPMGNMDPTQQRMMKALPLVFGIFFFSFPAGLVVYIFVNMVLTIFQQWIIRRSFDGATHHPSGGARGVTGCEAPSMGQQEA